MSGICGSISTQFLVAGSRDPTVSGLRGARSLNLNLWDPQYQGAGIYTCIAGFFCGKGLQILLFIEIGCFFCSVCIKFSSFGNFLSKLD